jgi:sec-independent protein translocase protein TatA
VVILFGASRIPEIGRGLGAGIQNFKSAMRSGPASGDDSSDADDTAL